MASTLETNAAANLILTSVSDATAAHAKAHGLTVAKPATVESIPAAFCEAWKAAKPILQGASLFLSWTPKVSGVLQGLLKIGDQIAADLGCS